MKICKSHFHRHVTPVSIHSLSLIMKTQTQTWRWPRLRLMCLYTCILSYSAFVYVVVVLFMHFVWVSINIHMQMMTCISQLLHPHGSSLHNQMARSIWKAFQVQKLKPNHVNMADLKGKTAMECNFFFIYSRLQWNKTTKNTCQNCCKIYRDIWKNRPEQFNNIWIELFEI